MYYSLFIIYHWMNNVRLPLLLPLRRQWIDNYRYRLGLLGNSSTSLESNVRHEPKLGHQDFFLFVPIVLLSIYSLFSSYSLPLFLCVISFLLFPCTSVHKFHISYSHTEWYLLFPLHEAMKI